MTATLFDRLGGEENIKKISNDLVEMHLINPKFKSRFNDSKPSALKKAVSDFLSWDQVVQIIINGKICSVLIKA